MHQNAFDGRALPEPAGELTALPRLHIWIQGVIGGGAYTPIGHWRISSKTDTPNMSFGLSVLSED